ncbi:TPA: hypothetical protein ACH3X3_004642 [Trebouxia sp. C0006]
MQIRRQQRCARAICLILAAARVFTHVDAQALLLPRSLPKDSDQSNQELRANNCSGACIDISIVWGSLNRSAQVPRGVALVADTGRCCHQGSCRSIYTSNDLDDCDQLPRDAIKAASTSLQTLHCLQSHVLHAAVILLDDTDLCQALRLTDADAPFGTALDSMCSQLASAGVYTNTVLQSTSALLHALCKPEAAALLAAIPQACRDAGRPLPPSPPNTPCEQSLSTSHNCPPEANTLFCCKSQDCVEEWLEHTCDLCHALHGSDPRLLMDDSGSRSASTASLGHATTVSVAVLGIFLVILLLFLGWKMRDYLVCPCCLPETDELSAMEANNLLDVAQIVHSATHAGSPGSRALPEHAIKKGFDHLPSYISAKLAGYKKAKQQKRRRGGSRAGTPNRASRVGSPSRGSSTPRGIQMTSRIPGSPEDRQRRKDKGKGQKLWDNDTSLDNSMRRSDASDEALIGVEPDQLDPELMQTDDLYPHSDASSASLPLTEQYSIASCSYPPLDMSNMQQYGDGVLLSAEASDQDLARSSYDVDETLDAEQSSV